MTEHFKNTISPVIICVVFLVSSALILINTGCVRAKANVKNGTILGGDTAKEGGTIKKETKIAENGTIETNIDNPIVENVDVEKIADIKADFSNKLSVLSGEIKELRDLTQTNNTGTFSGGAPYLLVVILAMLYAYKHSQVKNREREISTHKDVIEGLQTTMKTMSNNAKIQSITEVFSNRS